MNQLDAALRNIEKWPGGPLVDRLRAELLYARRVSIVNGGKYDALIETALKTAQRRVDECGALSNEDVFAVEKVLMPMQEACKKYRLLMVGHAHIDMNWMWRYDETVSITLDTFRTMLNLMEEFPDFTFAQSQASTYRIVEQFEPEMIDEIRARIQSNQWEVAASTWVEADRNLPSSESVARHFLYTKNYLPKLLGVKAEELNLDYEPDTFGHNENVPEMLSQGGVKFYYHCRGDDGEILTRWRAPSGAEIIVYREPYWYLGPINHSMAEFVPEFCERYGMDTAMRVYGVGDHGGGPTRRDLERIIDMGTWPIFPKVEFGLYRQFYAAAEAVSANLPITEGEKNFIFTGCYTTQTRIKAGNALSERHLYEAEALNAVANVNASAPYDRGAFENAWRNVLFNQFHDIIPGSGVIDTREHAMGLHQEAYAVAGTAIRAATAKLAAAIDTKAFMAGDPCGTTAEGAGVGFGVEGHTIAQVERGGNARSRIFHAFNALPYPRHNVVEVVLWDFNEDLDRIEIVDSNGNVVKHQLLDDKFIHYWQHQYTRILIEADLPALGYATFGLRVKEEMPPKVLYSGDMRLEKPFVPVLENERLRATFCSVSGALISLYDKLNDKEILGDGGARFMKITESGQKGMTSWTIGRYTKEESVSGVHLAVFGAQGALRNELRFETPIGPSNLSYTVSLDEGSDALVYHVTCDWLEPGSLASGIPQLQFRMGLSEEKGEYLYAVPGGAIKRAPQALDLPSLHMVAAEGGATLMSDTKYGFRGCGAEMSVTLIRSSYDPDPFPELGRHTFTLRVGVSSAKDSATLLREAQAAASAPIVVSGSNHEGSAPLSGSLLSVNGANVTAVKLCEAEDALIVRGFEANGKEGHAEIELAKAPRGCALVDTLEKIIPGDVMLDGNKVFVPLRKNGMFSVKIAF